MLVIKHKRKVLLFVIGRCEIALLAWRIGCETLSRIVHPSDYVFVIRFLADARQVSREVAADNPAAHVNRIAVYRMTAETAQRLEQLLAVPSITRPLSRQLYVQCGLPEEGGDRF